MGFLDVHTRETQTSLGPVRLPVLYADGASLLAFFRVEAARAARQLEGTGLEPAIFPGGHALHGLAFYDYRETAIGPYHEVGSALAVQRAGEPASMFDLFRAPAGRRLGFHILDLPVSTPIADAAGREIWGYPKFVTDLPQRYQKGAFSGAVMAPDGGEILRLEGRARWIVRMPSIDLLLYSHLRGQLLRTAVDVKAPTRIARGHGFRLTLGPAQHRMAESLRALGLDGARPLAVARCEGGFQCRLHEGVPVSASAAATPGTRPGSAGNRTGSGTQARP